MIAYQLTDRTALCFIQEKDSEVFEKVFGQDDVLDVLKDYLEGGIMQYNDAMQHCVHNVLCHAITTAVLELDFDDIVENDMHNLSVAFLPMELHAHYFNLNNTLEDAIVPLAIVITLCGLPTEVSQWGMERCVYELIVENATQKWEVPVQEVDTSVYHEWYRTPTTIDLETSLTDKQGTVVEVQSGTAEELHNHVTSPPVVDIKAIPNAVKEEITSVLKPYVIDRLISAVLSSNKSADFNITDEAIERKVEETVDKFLADKLKIDFTQVLPSVLMKEQFEYIEKLRDDSSLSFLDVMEKVFKVSKQELDMANEDDEEGEYEDCKEEVAGKDQPSKDQSSDQHESTNATEGKDTIQSFEQYVAERVRPTYRPSINRENNAYHSKIDDTFFIMVESDDVYTLVENVLPLLGGTSKEKSLASVKEVLCTVNNNKFYLTLELSDEKVEQIEGYYGVQDKANKQNAREMLSLAKKLEVLLPFKVTVLQHDKYYIKRADLKYVTDDISVFY